MYDVSLKRKWDAEAVRQYQEQLDQQLIHKDQQLTHTRQELENERREKEIARKEVEGERSKAEKDKRAIICNLIEESGFSDELIVRIVVVPLELVQEIRTNLKKTK